MTIDLSIIIVNYNVKHFLEQCLCSVRKAIDGLSAEVIVIDNCSVDHSLEYLRPRFPEVQFIANTENAGFAKACNQGLAIATGRYILFLNPDTLVPEDCFTRCIRFFNEHPDAGALGVKMVDGCGRFLKESKRSFPSPVTSLFKLTGLSQLFPRSGFFSRYHLGQLDEDQDHEVEVLAGAFMLIRKDVLDKVGGFDEAFFMYGEDIDLSYRIREAGFRNYYFAGTPIIHFKGESTRKDSANYVKMFYKAMSIFVSKHYAGGKAGIFRVLLHIAIGVRGLMAAFAGFIRKIGLPLIDAGLILLSFWVMKTVWNQYVRSDIEYSSRLLWITIPAFTLFYLLAAYYAGLYDRWYRRSELVRSTLIATVFLLAGYALLPEQYRFSRAIILLGALLAFVLISVLRWMLIRSGMLSDKIAEQEPASTLVVATEAEYQALLQLMQDMNMEERVLGRIGLEDSDKGAVGSLRQLQVVAHNTAFRELIFCEGTLSFREIIASLDQLKNKTRIRFHAAGSQSIVGSDSKDGSGEALSRENTVRLGRAYNLRLKRLTDLGVAILGITGFPILVFLVRKPGRFFINCWAVLFARMTWVGYATNEKKLPPLRKAVLACNGIPATIPQQLPAESLQMIDYWYARDYEPGNDLRLVAKMYRRLGGA